MQYKNNTFLKGLYHMTFDDYDNNGDFKQLLYENVIVTTDTKLNDTDKTSFTNLINKIDSVKNNISDHKEILNVWKELIDKIHDIDSQTKNIPTTEDLKYTALKYNALYNIFNYLSESFNDKKYTELQQKGMQILNKIKSKISKNNILLQSKKYDKKLIRTKTLEESFSYELEEEDEDNNEEISQDIIKNKLENIKKYVLS